MAPWPAELSAAALFELADWRPELFDPELPAWAALDRLSAYLAALTAGRGHPPAPPGVHFEGDIVIGDGVVIEPGVFVRGPAVLEAEVTLRQGAYLRGDVLLGRGALLGHCSEAKHSILWPGAHAPHFNYVGDSILGRRTNLGAGTVLSNVPLAGGTVAVRYGSERLDSGRRKLGALLGDGAQTGCQAVLNPGTVVGRGARIGPLANVVGFVAPGSVLRTPRDE
ncbi:MAG: hypothetical protein IT204_12075 [Fimbriimonadaceae bacterium]|nr:hypothetical protein [Fimbriimonadaceae bacterium]